MKPTILLVILVLTLTFFSAIACGPSVKDTAARTIGREPTSDEIRRACNALADSGWDINKAAVNYAVSDQIIVHVMAAIVALEGANSEQWCSKN
jgi:hypothetical protein